MGEKWLDVNVSFFSGALSDQAGDYEGAFYLAGAAIGLSGAICFPLRALSKWEKKKEKRIDSIYSKDTDLQLTTVNLPVDVWQKPKCMYFDDTYWITCI